MTREVPLLDGNTLDLDATVDAHADVMSGGEGRIVLSAASDFHAGQLPPWLTYATDNGPASPTYNADGSVTLETGSTSTGDDSWLSTSKSYLWDDWSAARFYVVGLEFGGDAAVGSVNWYNSGHHGDGTDGFAYSLFADSDIGGVLAANQLIDRNGSRQVTYRTEFDASPSTTGPHTIGFRVEEHELGTGHDIYWTVDAEPADAFSEGQGFPDSTADKMSVAVRTDDGANQTATIRNIVIELIP